jgi:hypothetical protein
LIHLEKQSNGSTAVRRGWLAVTEQIYRTENDVYTSTSSFQQARRGYDYPIDSYQRATDVPRLFGHMHIIWEAAKDIRIRFRPIAIVEVLLNVLQLLWGSGIIVQLIHRFDERDKCFGTVLWNVSAALYRTPCTYGPTCNPKVVDHSMLSQARDPKLFRMKPDELVKLNCRTMSLTIVQMMFLFRHLRYRRSYGRFRQADSPILACRGFNTPRRNIKCIVITSSFLLSGCFVVITP